MSILLQFERMAPWRAELESGAAQRAWEAASLDARQQFPTIALADDVFAELVVRQVADEPSFVQALATRHVADLYLAIAAARQLPEAVEQLEQIVSTETARAYGRVHPPIPVDEATQLVLAHLVVADGTGTTRLAAYRGQGTLRAWVRVAATRLLLNSAMRAPPDSPGREGELVDIALGQDPELLYLKRRYAAELKAAFEEAVAGLGAREVELLRLSFCDHVPIDGIGDRFGVHRATAARWLAGAKDSLQAAVRKALQRRLKVDERDFQSMLRVVESELHLSVSRVLGPGTR